MTHHLVGVSEIAVLLGVSRQRADQIVSKKGFPETVVVLASGRIWESEEVERWIEAGRTSPQAIVKSELAQLRPMGSKMAVGMFRSAYAMTRQKGLGQQPDGVPPTRRFAYVTGIEEARRFDPQLDVVFPIGWLEREGGMEPWSLFESNGVQMAEVYRFRVKASQVLSHGAEVEFTAPNDRRLIGNVIDFDEAKAHVRVKQISL